jgi:hypothetical protein
MTLTTTFKRLRAARACTERYKFLRAALKGTKDAEPINLLTILETNGLDDALWALRATVENCDVPERLMAADFAEQVLPIWQKYSDAKLPELAIKASRDFAYGRITREELAAARAAAAGAAGEAAWAAAWAAAGAAARAAWAAAARAAWAAAGAAGEAAWAAREAAWAARAAGAAGDAAARAVARDAAWEKQREIFVSYLQPTVHPRD